jgi:hypothetical protein
MLGLEISRRYFAEWGLPYLQREWPELVNRAAAGRVGSSDTVGEDDEWSQNQELGPSFELWLTRDDYRRSGSRLQHAINSAAPIETTPARYRSLERPKETISVASIDAVFERQLGCTTPPARARDWFAHGQGESLVDREARLYFMKHSAIFHDPLGEFTTRRDAFSQYPRDVRLKVMHTHCTTLWTITNYKFGWRLVHRTDPYPLHSAISQFAEAAMRLCFSLHNDFAPHWQWLHYQFLRLPESVELGPILDRFLGGRSAQECADVVPEVTEFLTRRLAELKLIQPGHADMQRAAEEVRAHIGDEVIREME